MTYTAPGKGPALFPLPLPLAHQREQGRRPTPEPAPPAGRAGGQIIARPGAGANTERTQKPHNSPENHNSAATIDCAADFLPVPFGPDRLRPAGSGSRFPAFADRFGLIPSFLVGIQCAFYPSSLPAVPWNHTPYQGSKKRPQQGQDRRLSSFPLILSLSP